VSEVWVGGRRLFTGFVRDITERRRLEKAILDISGAEQQRIGQDLHDGLGQHLTGIAFKARVLADELQSDAPRHARPAREIGSLVQEAISRTRDLAHGLAPVGLQKHGLSTALQELARSTQQMGVRCTFKCGRPAAIENETVGLHLYRIAQESVNNAIKHGRARNVSIMLDSRRGEITLKIRDDGIGYPEISSDKSGIGQKIMQYRASLIGAALLIRPVPGSGTVVICSLRESQPTTKDNRNGNGQGARRRASTQKNRSARR
jgi:signal transduction histidine kinase